MSDYSAFETNQQNYFVNEINRAIPTSVTPDASSMRSMLNIIDPHADASTYNNFNPSQFTSTFNTTTMLRKDDTCRRLTAPSVGMRDPTARTGCGWWYTPSSNSQSVGAYGTRRGPMNPNLDREYGAGQWVWNPTDAIRLESQKVSSHIRNCSDLAYTTYKNIGWCRSSNRAIVLDSQGLPAYGSDCNVNDIVVSAEQCNPSFSCRGLGRPSDDNSVRLYSKQECDTLGGNWHGNGECMKKDGGSWSWNCRGLNPGNINTGQADSCVPLNGKLTPGCLQTIVNAQCNTTGTLSSALRNSYAGQDSGFNDMNSVLAARGFNIPSGIINDGNLTVQAAIAATSQIKTWATDANPRTAGAAKNLCFGTAFDACGYSNTDPKPFSAMCIARAATAAGWSPNGTGMPANDNMANWRSLNTWADVLAQIAAWKNNADNPGNRQLDFIHKVYGPLATYPDKCSFSVPIYKSAVTFLPLNTDARDLGKRPSTAITNGSVQYTTVGDKLCAYFNNDDGNYISIPNIIDVTNFSFSFTFNVPTGDYYTMVSLTNSNFDPSLQCDISLPGRPRQLANYLALPNKWAGFIYQNNNPVALNTWYTMTVVVTGSSAITYLNGQPYNTITGTAPLKANPTWFLGRSGTNGRPADVYMCNFAVWNTALTAAEAASLTPRR